SVDSPLSRVEPWMSRINHEQVSRMNSGGLFVFSYNRNHTRARDSPDVSDQRSGGFQPTQNVSQVADQRCQFRETHQLHCLIRADPPSPATGCFRPVMKCLEYGHGMNRHDSLLSVLAVRELTERHRFCAAEQSGFFVCLL